MHDPSLDPFSQRLGPGVDPHVSYVTTLTKTSVEILNVQLPGGDSKELHSKGAGALMVALTDLNLLCQEQDGKSKVLQLSKGDVEWFPGAATLKNQDKAPPAAWFWK